MQYHCAISLCCAFARWAFAVAFCGGLLQWPALPLCNSFVRCSSAVFLCDVLVRCSYAVFLSGVFVWCLHHGGAFGAITTLFWRSQKLHRANWIALFPPCQLCYMKLHCGSCLRRFNCRCGYKCRLQVWPLWQGSPSGVAPGGEWERPDMTEDCPRRLFRARLQFYIQYCEYKSALLDIYDPASWDDSLGYPFSIIS